MCMHIQIHVRMSIYIRYLLEEPSASLVDFLLMVLEYSFFQELDNLNPVIFFFLYLILIPAHQACTT